MLDPGNAQHMATYPALSFPKHNTPSPHRWKGLHLPKQVISPKMVKGLGR